MQRLIAVLAALAAVGATIGLSGPVWPVSALHDDGTGFVSGADVQAATGWDGATLQANAAALQFVAETGSVTEMTWDCVDTGTSTVLSQRTDLLVTESRGIAASPKVLWWGTVVGFRLEGFDGTGASSAAPEGPAPNSCPPGPWTLAPGSAQTVETTGGTVLMAVHGGLQHPVPMP
ncbi:hypothetical protein ACH9EU_02940 [Kocuria sp. M1R5S2]|uniref:hypothetical protein n=1 Tax=Kocuria rhizosphaerae TaxID=3376285 RepID=UPI00378D1308